MDKRKTYPFVSPIEECISVLLGALPAPSVQSRLEICSVLFVVADTKSYCHLSLVGPSSIPVFEELFSSTRLYEDFSSSMDFFYRE